MQKQNKLAFTLVELIVVITILAILATIAFISLQGYGSNSRDSKRLSDLGNMKKVLELYSLKNGHYPNPDNVTNINYSGSIAWYLGEFGEEVRRAVERINPSPKDPLTDTYYAYGLTNNRQEYELATILENANNASLNIITQANANSEGYTAYISGNYNKKILSVRTGNTIKILGVPTLITTDPSITELNSITDQERRSLFSINNKTNLPGNIIEKINTGILGEGFVVTAEEIYENGAITNTDINNGATSILLYEGTIEDLGTDLIKTKVGENIRLYYTGTESTLGNLYQEIASAEGIVILDTLISNRQGGLNSNDIPLSNNNSLTWRALDSNCNIDDVKVGSQIWAGCNSTLGNGFDYGQIDLDIGTDNYNGSVGSCFDYNGNNTGVCIKGDITMNSNSKANTWFSGTNINGDREYDTIWGKFYTWNSLDTNGDNIIDSNDTNKVCGFGYHVPSDEEWNILISNINGGIDCEDGNTGWLCTGLGWELHSDLSKTNENNVANALKLPLSGHRNTNNSTFDNRGYGISLWTSTPIGGDAYRRHFGWYNSGVARYLSNKGFGFSVRCIKDN